MPESAPKSEAPASYAAPEAELSRDISGLVAPAPVAEPRGRVGAVPGVAAASKMMADESARGIAPADLLPEVEQDRDRFAEFKTNPVRSAATDPVSTFSIDVDTASYSFVRRSLKEGFLPQADTVRVEEMINYFPYDWKGPDTASTPFNSTVTVMPTPWNANTRLMHVAIKGYDLKPAEQPKANLVFLLDVSGSMNAPDKLPLLRSAFRLLVSKLNPDDTVSIVTYAGEAGTVLMPTKVLERAKILSAIDNLTPGGTTAGEAGLKEAYKLAEQSFVGGEHHPVDATLDEGLFGKLVGLLDAGLTRRRAAGRQIVDRRQDLCALRHLGRHQHGARLAGIGDDRHSVVGVELRHQQAEGGPQQRQLVRRVHRAGNVEQEDEVRLGLLGRLHVIALDRDMHELGVCVPRRRGDGQLFPL